MRSRKFDSRVTSGDLTAPMSDRPSETHLDQRHAPEDERAQDALAKLGLGDEQRPKRLGRDDDRLHVADRPGVEHAQVRPSGELSDLGHDLARHHLRHFLDRRPDQLRESVHRHRLPQPVAGNDRDPAGEDHVHPGHRLARLEQELSGRESPDLAETPDAVDLRPAERTGNIWLNRDARAALDVTGGAGAPVPRCLALDVLVLVHHE